MASEWKETTVGEFSPFSYGKNLPAEKRKQGRVPVVSSAGISGAHDEALVESKGIVIGRKGTVGSLTYCDRPFWPIDTAFFIADEPERRDLRFTFYLLHTLNLSDMNSDSAVPGLNRANAHARKVRIPPIAEQKAIAAALGALDDKIELNRRMNATLEAMARALFQSWFVDFDPVRAKLDGRPPAALDRVTAALFPDSFQDSEVGRIPTGWTVRSLGEIIDLGSGVPYEAKFKGDSGLPMITLGCVSFHDRFQDKGLTYYSGGYKESHVVKTDDLVVASHDVTQERKQLGSPAMVPRWLKGSTILAATNLYMVRNNSKFPNQYLYQLFRAEGFRQQMVASAKGTVILFISKDSILRHQLAWPSDELAAHFSTEAEALYSQYSINTAQSRTLATLRDTLLPKLLSGELSVAAATGNRDLQVQPGMPKP